MTEIHFIYLKGYLWPYITEIGTVPIGVLLLPKLLFHVEFMAINVSVPLFLYILFTFCLTTNYCVVSG